MALDPITGMPIATTVPPASVQPAQPNPLPMYQAPTYSPGQNFQFDPNKYLPGIQQQASSIYDPQKAQIQALQALGQNQTQQTKVTTEKQFADELTSRIEAINARGAFFGGGALTNQADIGQRKTQALTNIDLQQQAADLASQAQQAGLNVAQTQYIQEQLTSGQNSAYNMWKDQYDMYTQQQQMKQAQANADRAYELELKKIKEDKKSTRKQREADKKKAKKDYEAAQAELTYKYAALNKKGSSGSQNRTETTTDEWGNKTTKTISYD